MNIPQDSKDAPATTHGKDGVADTSPASSSETVPILNVSSNAAQLSSRIIPILKVHPPTARSSFESKSSSKSNSTSNISPILSRNWDNPYPILSTATSPAPRHQPSYMTNSNYSPSRSSGNIGTTVLHHSKSEYMSKHRPRESDDSGISLNAPNGLHNAKVSTRAMGRAMNEISRPGPVPIQNRNGTQEVRSPIRDCRVDAARKQSENNKRRSNCDLNSLPSMQKEANPCFPKVKRRNAQRSPPKYGGGRRVSAKNRQAADLNSLPPTTGLNSRPNHTHTQTQTQTPMSAREVGRQLVRFASQRHPRRQAPSFEADDLARTYREIEQQEKSTRDMILDGHFNLIPEAVMPPLKEGPRREVQIVDRTGRRDMHRGDAGRMGDVGAEIEMETEQAKKKRGILKRLTGWFGKRGKGKVM